MKMDAETESNTNSLIEVRLSAQEQAVLELSEALEVLGALCVCVEDADATTEAEAALFVEPGQPPPKEAWRHSILQAFFTDRASAEDSLDILQKQDFWKQTQVLGVDEVASNDWVRMTQSQFQAVEVSPYFWVVPSWHSVPAQAKVSITLDPGLAFGTGTHPTTRMCLRWIAQSVSAGMRVLDYGCGSGILAIAATKHGGYPVDAVDIDPQAVQASQENAQKNHSPMRVGFAEVAQGEYDVVLANILASPLKVLAPLLCSHVKSSGFLVLAGVLKQQLTQLQEAYAPYVDLQVQDEEEAWVLLVAQKPKRPAMARK